MLKRFIHIVARSSNNGIGYKGELLWKLKKDLEYFKEKTLNHTCIVGRKTYDTIKHLKDRNFIVVTRDKDYSTIYDNAIIVSSVQDAIDYANAIKSIYNRVYIIGGAEIYKQTFQYVDELLITEVENISPPADTFYDYSTDDFMYHSSSDMFTESGIIFTFQKYIKSS